LVSTLNIWKAEILIDATKDKSPRNRYGSYVAMDQIIRGLDRPANLQSNSDNMEMMWSIRELVRLNCRPPRSNWRSIPEDKRWPQETVLGVADDIEKTRLGHNLSWFLGKNKGIPTEVIRNSCGLFDFSRWTPNLADESGRWAHMTECQTGHPDQCSETMWREIIEGRMLFRNGSHTYVRTGGLLNDFNIAMERAFEDLRDKLTGGGTETPMTMEQVAVPEDPNPYR
jgi:hypothetical protein